MRRLGLSLVVLVFGALLADPGVAWPDVFNMGQPPPQDEIVKRQDEMNTSFWMLSH